MGGEELQELVLHIGEVERPALDRGLVGLEVHDQWAAFHQLGTSAAAGTPEQMGEARLDLARARRLDAEVVEQVLAQLELAHLARRHHEQQRLEGQVSLPDGAAQREGGFGIVERPDERARPAVVGLEAARSARVAYRLPRVAGQVEDLLERGRRRIREEKEGFHRDQRMGKYRSSSNGVTSTR